MGRERGTLLWPGGNESLSSPLDLCWQLRRARGIYCLRWGWKSCFPIWPPWHCWGGVVVRCTSLLLGGSERVCSMLGLLWHHPGWEGEGHLITAWWGLEVSSLSSDTSLVERWWEGCFISVRQGWRSKSSTWPLLKRIRGLFFPHVVCPEEDVYFKKQNKQKTFLPY